MEEPSRPNGWAIVAVILAFLATIIILLVVTLGYALEFVAVPDLWMLVIQALTFPLSGFVLAAYPLAFVLGVIGLTLIYNSKGRENGKGLAWIAIVLSSAGLLLMIGGMIYGFAFLPNSILPTATSPQPVSEGQRFDFPIFSIGAPEGSGWTYQPLQNGIRFDSTAILDDQKTIYSQRANVALAWHEALDQDTNYSSQEFLDYACGYLGPADGDTRYSEKAQDCKWWRKSTFVCVRFHGEYLDHGTKAAPYSPPLMIDGYSLACRHPDFYNALVFLHYSQEGPEGSLQEDIARQADAFFRGMGMNYPQGTPPAGFEYETSDEIQTAQPGTNLAYQKQVRVSRALTDFPARMAVDGRQRNWWGAGARPPQWIEIDLGENYVIREVRLLTSQSPPGRTIHRVLAKGVGTADEFQLIHTFDGVTADTQLLTYKLPEPLRGVRYIRIETTYSPSWVSWREIEVIAGE